MRDRIDFIHYQEVQPGDIWLHCSTDPYHNTENDWDRDLCKTIREAAAQGSKDTEAIAFGYPRDAPTSIMLMPGWYRKSNAASSILVHEASHILLGLRGHPTEVPHRDPYAIQGFVAALGGLTAPESDRRYPARKP